MENLEEKVPKWLDRVFLEKALRSFKDDETIDILDYKLTAGFSEHFASTMFRCKIDFKSLTTLDTETLSLVIKAEPVNEGMKMDVVSQGPLFETEIKMYTETIPAINQLFKKSGLKADLAPELIYAAEKPFPVIILKNLTPDGFSACRQPPDDIEDSKVIIERLAQFHAASFYLAENNEQDFTGYNYSIYQSKSVIDNTFNEGFEAFKEVLATWEGFEDYVSKIDYIAANVAEIGGNSYVPNKPGYGFNVLNHADFHVRNILFKHDQEQRIDSIRFIDFQISCFCSPAIDLSYIYGLVKLDDNGNFPKEELIMFYHEEFVKALKLFGYSKSPPSLLDVNLELLKHGRLNVLISISFIPFTFVDWQTTKVEDFFPADAEKRRTVRKSLFEHPACKALIQNELKSWLHKGWLSNE